MPAVQPIVVKACTLTLSKMKFAYLDMGPLTLVAQGPEDEADAFLSAHLNDVRVLLAYYLGDFHKTKDDMSIVKGVLVSYYPRLDVALRRSAIHALLTFAGLCGPLAAKVPQRHQPARARRAMGMTRRVRTC
jgi:hypothetical protein